MVSRRATAVSRKVSSRRKLSTDNHEYALHGGMVSSADPESQIGSESGAIWKLFRTRHLLLARFHLIA
jgi:hypothetical protein